MFGPTSTAWRGSAAFTAPRNASLLPQSCTATRTNSAQRSSGDAAHARSAAQNDANAAGA